MPNGYGKLGHNKKTYLAHRFAWEATYGAIPDGMHVLHKCDNRKCINPEHLFLGTRKDNMQDMIKKGRAKFVGLYSKNWVPPKPNKGEINGRSVLTNDKVIEIRQYRHKTNKKISDIAKVFKVSFSTIQRVLARKNWSHIES